MKRIALVIDGHNHYATSKLIGLNTDYGKLAAWVSERGMLVRSLYYSMVEESESGTRTVQPLLDWLDYNGFNVITKPMLIFETADGRRKITGSMHVEMTVDMLDLAPRLDEIVLVTGHGEMRAAVEAVQRRGVRVTVVSTIKTPSPQVSDDLRRQADEFVDLMTLVAIVAAPARAARTIIPGGACATAEG